MSYQNEEEGVVFIWNTGRQYDKNGQVMAAVKLKFKDKVLFWDHSRHIEGCLPAKRGNILEQTMAAYDNGCYETTSCFDYPEVQAELKRMAMDWADDVRPGKVEAFALRACTDDNG
jgi:hypothetical protein